MLTEQIRRRYVLVGYILMLNIDCISYVNPVFKAHLNLSFVGVDQCIQKFLDVARQTECFFLQKRLQLSVQKPEQVVKEVNCYTD